MVTKDSLRGATIYENKASNARNIFRRRLQRNQVWIFVLAMLLMAILCIDAVRGSAAVAADLFPVIAILACAYYFRLRNGPLIYLSCPHCGKVVSSDIEWRCGYCETVNTKHPLLMFENSFLNKCVECKQAPNAFLCQHCRKFIFFTADKNSMNAAMEKTTQPPPPPEPPRPPKPPPPPPDEETIRRRERAKREHEILMLKLDAEYEQQTAHLNRIKGVRKSHEDDLAEAKERVIKRHEILRRELKLADEQYRDDPEMREIMKEFLEDWKDKLSV